MALVKTHRPAATLIMSIVAKLRGILRYFVQQRLIQAENPVGPAADTKMLVLTVAHLFGMLTPMQAASAR